MPKRGHGLQRVGDNGSRTDTGFINQIYPQGARAGGGSQSTHTHVGRSTQLDGRTSATRYVQDMRDTLVAVGQMYRSVEDVATEPTARELVRRRPGHRKTCVKTFHR
jgi:hypothetical protein